MDFAMVFMDFGGGGMDILKSPSFCDSYPRTQLYISHSGWVQTDKSWHQTPLQVPYSRIYFIREGSGWLLTDRTRIRLEPGYAYLAPCGAPCGFYGTDSVTKLFFHIQMTTANGYDLFSAATEPVRIPFDSHRISELKEWYFSNDTLKQTFLKCMLWETVAAFMKELRFVDMSQNSYSASVSSAVSSPNRKGVADLGILGLDCP